MTLVHILTFSLVVFLVAFKPGPGIFIHTSRARESGWIAGIQMALGTECSHVILLTISLFYVETIKSTEFMEFAYIVGVFGGLYIAFGGTIKPEGIESKGKYFIDGLLFGPSNPVNITFYITIVPPIFVGTLLTFMDAIILNIILFVIIFSSHLFYFYLSFRIRKFDSDIVDIKVLRLSLKQISRCIIIIIGLSLSILNIYELCNIRYA